MRMLQSVMSSVDAGIAWWQRFGVIKNRARSAARCGFWRRRPQFPNYSVCLAAAATSQRKPTSGTLAFPSLVRDDAHTPRASSHSPASEMPCESIHSPSNSKASGHCLNGFRTATIARCIRYSNHSELRRRVRRKTRRVTFAILGRRRQGT